MMPIPRKYLHDKIVLLLVSSNIFLGFLAAVLIFLRLDVGEGSDGYIVQYRSNLGISAFQTGGISSILGFAVLGLLVILLNIGLSIRTYNIRRELSVAVLSSGVLILLMGIIVSNGLMVLH